MPHLYGELDRLPYISRSDELAAYGKEILRLAEKPASFTALFEGLYISPDRASRLLSALEMEGLIAQVVFGSRRLYQTTPKGRGAIQADHKTLDTE